MDLIHKPRDQQDKQPLVRTFTGRYVNPLAITPEDVCIEDIAHHLSNVCRFTGATPGFYSVAQHSLQVVWLCDLTKPYLWKAALLHDAAEAYLCDVPSPVKHSPQMAFYRDAEERASRAIFERFNVPYSHMKEIKKFDDAMFHHEVEWFWGGRTGRLDLMTPDVAEALFLKEFNSVKGVH